MKPGANNFGRAIRLMREIYNYTQAEVAQKVGISAISISKYESGYAFPKKPSTLCSLCQALHFPLGSAIELWETNEPELSPYKLFTILKPNSKEEETLYIESMSICRSLKLVRLLKGYTFEDVCHNRSNGTVIHPDKSDRICYFTLQNTENYKSSPSTLTIQLICQKYQISVEKLMSYAEATREMNLTNAAMFIAQDMSNEGVSWKNS